MHTDAFIEGRRIVLRAPRESDAKYFTQWVNNPKVRKYLMSRMPKSLLAEKEWVTSISKPNRFPESIVMVIEVRGDNKPIGVMGLHNINWIDRNATTGSMIGNLAYHGKGYATDAKMHFLKYAFETLGMHKISSRAYAENVASIAYSKRCGYTQEAVLKEEAFREGKWGDIVLLACFYDTWKDACAKHGWSELL